MHEIVLFLFYTFDIKDIYIDGQNGGREGGLNLIRIIVSRSHEQVYNILLAVQQAEFLPSILHEEVMSLLRSFNEIIYEASRPRKAFNASYISAARVFL